MNTFKLTSRFTHEDDGAVTVDWVVLTAAIVGIGVAILYAVTTRTESVAKTLTDGLNDHTTLVQTAGSTLD